MSAEEFNQKRADLMAFAESYHRKKVSDISEHEIEKLSLDAIKTRWSHCFINNRLIQTPKHFKTERRLVLKGIRALKEQLINKST